MEFLPNLEIQEDLENLESDEEVVDVVCEDLSMPIKEPSPMDIFKGKPTNGQKIGKPTNKKRVIIPDPTESIEAQSMPVIEEEEEEEVVSKPIKKQKKPLSAKQKAHLDRIRKLALEKKREKAQMRKEALKKVNEDYESKKAYKKRTIKVNEKIEEPPSPPPERKQFKERVEKHYTPEKEEDTALLEDNAFIGFMENMGKYQRYMINHQNKQNKNKPQRQAPPPPAPPKPVQKRQPAPPPPHLLVKENDPYADIFKW